MCIGFVAIWLAAVAYLLLRWKKLCLLSGGKTYAAVVAELHAETERTGELVRAYAEAWQQRLARAEAARNG